MDTTGILPKRMGWSIHDFWIPYMKYPHAPRALCNAHLMRALVFLVEQCQPAWAGELTDWLSRIKPAVETAQREQRSALRPEQIADFEAQYQQWVAQGEPMNPLAVKVARQRGQVKQSVAGNLLDRLRNPWEKLLAVVEDSKGPFDTKLSDRNIRMAKIHQKVEGGFRSENGAEAFGHIRRYILTAGKNG